MNIDLDKLVFYKGEGCKECSGLGYKGQIGIFEILKITDEIKDIILAEKVSENRIKEIAKREGMVSLAQDGIIKALRGITALEEVFRVVK